MSTFRAESSLLNNGSSEMSSPSEPKPIPAPPRQIVDFVEPPLIERIHGVVHVHVNGESIAGSIVRYPGEKRALDRGVVRLPDGTQYPLDAQELRRLGY